MKNTFRKAMTVLGSFAMIGATIGAAAAAAYPAPFTSNSAIVTGVNADASDLTAAAKIATALESDSTDTTAPVTIADDAEYILFDKTSTKWQYPLGLLDVDGSSVDKKDLPTVLADGIYVDDDNNENDYKQTISMANLTYSLFDDDDYKRDTPTVGFDIASGANILNYTLDFTDTPYWNSLTSTDIEIMGKNYYVLSTATTNDTITLLDASDTVIVVEGETKTMVVDGETYEVSIDFVTSDSEAKITVNGITTNSLGDGDTQKLKGGAYIGIKDVSYNAKETGLSRVELSIGSGKMILEDGQEVEMNEETIDNLLVEITNSSTTKLDKIVLQWNAEDEMYVAPDSVITMPGFENLKFSFTGMTYPSQEEIVIRADGDDNLILDKFPLKGTTETINLLYTDGTNFTVVGKDANNQLATAGPGMTLNFTENEDDYFVISYKSGDDAESYLVRVNNFDDSEFPDNTVDFEYLEGGAWKDLDTAVLVTEEVEVGSNAVFTVATISNESSKTVSLTAAGNNNFYKLYSAEGLEVTLPWVNDTNRNIVSANVNASATVACAYTAATDARKAGYGQIGYSYTVTYNKTSTNASATGTCSYYAPTFDIMFDEEDKDDAIAAGDAFNVSIGLDTDGEVYVTGITGDGTAYEIGESEVYQSYVSSALNTEIKDDQGGDHEKVTITYHGGESYGKVYLTAASAVSAGGEAGVLTFKDSEASSFEGKNLIVVGGSAINSIAAELLGSAYSEAAFTAETGVAAGEFLIQSFKRESSGKTALLVAGYNAEDTTKAATYLLNNAVDTTVGKKYKGTSATSAELVTTTA